ncbi:diguanylate cyclase [Paraglaciecola sp. L3A3]|uniref:diguanylate cyclase n=1 Tax=Paraglaciecola sp. L3A3 TaxID=2686358 RepID=UPI00131CA870|nr:diguanylate cyclase [Paraglaciecola sp. L3A3]
MSTQSFEDKLKELRNLFIFTLPDNIASIITKWQQLQIQWDLENGKSCIFALHNLKGSSGTLGYDEISNAIGHCENLLKTIINNKTAPTDSDYLEINQQFLIIDKAKQALLIKGKQPTERHEINPPTVKFRPASPQTEDINVLIIDDVPSTGEVMKKQLTEFGFNTSLVPSLHAAKSHLQKAIVQLVIVNLVIADCTTNEVFNFIAECETNNIRTFIISEQDNFELRLAAVSANASNYILRPYQITNLVYKMRSALYLDLVRPFKVLLVDDQSSVASYFKSTLEQNNMEVKILLDGTKVLESLTEFEPDIFLLDLHMPKVNGIKLAKVIRLIEKYDSIPIVFLTSENTIQIKLDVLEVGCDDVISKNIPPDSLIKQIMSRLKRGKTLRYLNSRDSLTSLLNHGQIMEATENALQTGIRRGTSTIIVMVDLDHFKAVNDKYGHASGDKVLIGLSQLFLQHIRSTDYIGRYGGEEFLLVFPDSSLHAIQQKVENIRNILSTIQFKHEDINFNVTLSAGIACSDNFESSMPKILLAADKALYKAKESGRNNVQLATLPTI